MTNPISRIFGHAALAALCLGSLGAPGAASAADAETLAPLAFLGLTAAEGKTETGDDAGKLEAQLLLLPLIKVAAKNIMDASTKAAGTDHIIPVVGETGVDLKPYAIVTRRLDLIDKALTGIPPGTCVPAKTKDNKSLGEMAQWRSFDTSPSAVLSSALGLLKTDTKLTGLAATATDELILNALLTSAGLTSNLRVAQDFQTLDLERKDGLWARFEKLSDKVAALTAAGCKDNKTYGGTYALAKSELEDMAKGGEKGAPSQLEQALGLEGLVAPQGEARQHPLILRIKREYTGGTLINRQNVFTTLGAQALSFRAGLTLSYRLFDPVKGTMKAVGLVSCTTKPVGFKRIYSVSRLDAGPDDCFRSQQPPAK